MFEMKILSDQSDFCEEAFEEIAPIIRQNPRSQVTVENSSYVVGTVSKNIQEILQDNQNKLDALHEEIDVQNEEDDYFEDQLPFGVCGPFSIDENSEYVYMNGSTVLRQNK